MKLNPEQQEAIHAISRPLLVLAGAGSGKTRVITEKIAYLVRECGYDPKSIFAVTFTNKAAKEMAERIKKTLGQEGKRVRIATFHTLGLAILKKHGAYCGLKKNFSIYDQEDSLKLMVELLNGDNDEAKLMLYQISAWKNDHLTVEEAKFKANTEFLTHAATLYETYQLQLTAYNAGVN